MVEAKPFTKSQSNLRWVVLFLSCVMMIGNYYCYDNPAALKTQIDDYMGDPDNYETMFSLLYTVYSIPNVILPFFGGFFVDKMGVRICLIVFAAFISLGQLVFTIGLQTKSWPIMFIGRVIYGFGGESLAVGNSALLADWFTGKELAFAFGLNLSIARLGSVVNNLVSPSLADSDGVVFALWFGCIICAISFGAVLLLLPVDAAMQAIINKQAAQYEPLLNIDEEEETDSPIHIKNEPSDDLSNIKSVNKSHGDVVGVAEVDNLSRSNDMVVKQDDEDKAEVAFSTVFTFGIAFWVLTVSCVVVYGCVLPFNNIASSLLMERNYFMEPPSECHLQNPNECQRDDNQPVDCPSSKWYQPPLPTFFDAGDIDCTDDYWSDVCTKEYCDRQSDGEIQAATVMSIPYIISACMSPILGGFIDRYGMRAIIGTVAPLALVVVHTLLGHSDVDPVGPLVGQGLAYSGFAAVLWPAIPLVIEPQYIGLAYGVVTSVQNCGLASFPLIVAQIYNDSGDKYIPNVENFFVGLAVLGVLVGIYLNVYDAAHDNIFNRPKQPDDAGDDEDADEKDDVVEEVLFSNSHGRSTGDRMSRDGRLSKDGLHQRGRIVSTEESRHARNSKGSFTQGEEVYRALSGSNHRLDLLDKHHQ